MSNITSDAFLPITAKTRHKIIISRLKTRAKHPDLWADQWPGDPQLLEVRDRFSRILLFYCHWPNAFFIPDDYAYTMIDAGYFDSLDVIQFIMTLEEMFDIRIDSEHEQKMSIRFYHGGNYLQLLQSILDIFTGVDHKWEPFSLPPDYYDTSTWQHIKRRLTLTWSNSSLHRELRQSQVARPQTWMSQWEGYDDSVIKVRDLVSRILVDKLAWFDDSFIPQDRLDAVFHNICGPEMAAETLSKINAVCQSNVEFDFIASGRHTYADFLKKIAKNS